MRGANARLLTPMRAISLDELVAADHVYRHVGQVLYRFALNGALILWTAGFQPAPAATLYA